jgi:hypothetical protein
MIVSTSTQVIWFDRSVYKWESNGSPVSYTLGPNKEKQYGVYNGIDKIYADPIGYYDKQMVYHDWVSSNSFVAPFSFMVDQMFSYEYITEKRPVTCMINIKLTKEIGDKLQLSFFANNFLNFRPVYRSVRTDSYSRMNQPAYFGAELKLSL